MYTSVSQFFIIPSKLDLTVILLHYTMIRMTSARKLYIPFLFNLITQTKLLYN